MRLLVYNHLESDIPLHHESQVLKTIYLFAGQVISAGTSPALFLMQQLGFNQKTVRNKLDFLIRISEAHGWVDEVRTFKEMAQTLKKHQQVKHPSAKQIIAFRKFEQQFLNMYPEMVQSLGDQRYCAHYNMMLPLLEEKVFGTMLAQVEDPEEIAEGKEPLSRFFLGEAEEAESDLLYHDCLTPKFFTDGPGAALRSAGEVSPTVPFVAPLFSVPNLNVLSAPELKVLRGELKEAATPLHKAVQEWWEACQQSSDAGHQALFKNAVQPAGEAFAAAIDASLTLKPYQHLPDKLEVLVGVAPLGIIWQHLRHHGAIPDATWEVLQAAEEKSGALELFFCTRHHIPDVAPQSNFTQDQAATVTKRSLVID
ncbi:MAG: hypothetical protein JWP69_1263 [Flaviaesturariibacter sp.]|nr:hypothetical protein [Flaviaesturariibacter sp.]